MGPADKDALSASAAQLQSKSSELRLAIAEQNPQEVMKLVTRTTSIVNELRQNTITGTDTREQDTTVHIPLQYIEGAY